MNGFTFALLLATGLVASSPEATNPLACFAQDAACSSSARLGSCVSLNLSIADIDRDAPLKGLVEIQNNCDESIAILTSPTELRIRVTKARIPWEGWDTGQIAYATLYVFTRKLGLSHAFAGDAVLQVKGMPGYAVVSPRSIRRVPISDTAPHRAALKAGHYAATLLTFAAESPPADPGTDSEFDLSHTLTLHNDRHRDARVVRLKATVEPVKCSIAHFRIR
jgi:hypothetical protein